MTALAVIGMACRFPGAADLAGYWRLIRDGRVVTGPVGADRWRHEPFYAPEDPRAADKAYTDRVAHLADVRSFPAAHFGLPPRRVEVTDPQHRLLVELAREALQDAGLERRPLPRPSTGVYVGASVSEYKDLLVARLRARQLADGQFGAAVDAGTLAAAAAGTAPARAYTIPGTLLNLAAAAVSHAFDLGGPSFVIDAACASALVAVHEAAMHLATGACDLALAGGVYLNLVPDNLVGFSRIGAVSRSGVCRPFDRRADGFVLGEGAGVVVLRRLDEALAAGDRVYAVVRGTGCGNDGRAEGPMTPRLAGQVACLQRAYANAGVRPGTVGYLECHGTATAAGDAVELAALRRVWTEHQDAGPCAVGSVKANIGHTMSAAGIAGFIKTALALHHATIPPQPSCEAVDPALFLDGAPFTLADGPRRWPERDRQPRRAAVSAFGFGGTNAHVILEEAPARTAFPGHTVELHVLSADTTALLTAYAEQLASVVDQDDPPLLADVAYTLATRTPLRSRAVVAAETTAELARRLRQLSTDRGNGTPASDGVWLSDDGTLPIRAARFLAGDDADPLSGMPNDGRRVTHLPASPVDSREYWAIQPAPGQQAQTPSRPPADVLDGLLAAVAGITAFDADTLHLDAHLIDDLGFDSLLMEELAEQLGRTWPAALTLPPHLVRGQTTLRDLADWLTTVPRPTPPLRPAVPSNPAAASAASPGPPAAPRSSPSGTAAAARFPEIDALDERRELISTLQVADPYFVRHDGTLGATTSIAGQQMLDFSGYDYLGLSADPAVVAAAKAAIDRYGTSVSASRVASGERPLHHELETALATHLGAEEALTFVSGHATNVTVLGHLLGPGDLLVCDALAHDSILQGARLSGADRRTFPHNDVAALDTMLAAVRHRYRRVLVAVEGVYSMDGDLADLPTLVTLRDRHDVMVYVDEAHSVGVLGAHGRGAAEHWGLDPGSVDLWMGTLSKALASCGGYVAGPATLITYLRYTAPGFVYSVGLSPSAAAAALAALHKLAAEPRRARTASCRADRFRHRARQAGLDTGLSNDATAIVPIVVGDSATALQLSDGLRRRGVNAPPILFPAVAEEQARLRFFFKATHTESHIDAAVDALTAEHCRIVGQRPA